MCFLRSTTVVLLTNRQLMHEYVHPAVHTVRARAEKPVRVPSYVSISLTLASVIICQIYQQSGQGEWPNALSRIQWCCFKVVLISTSRDKGIYSSIFLSGLAASPRRVAAPDSSAPRPTLRLFTFGQTPLSWGFTAHLHIYQTMIRCRG